VLSDQARKGADRLVADTVNLDAAFRQATNEFGHVSRIAG
jgi:hypothetical protein